MKTRLLWTLIGVAAAGATIGSIVARATIEQPFPAFWALFGAVGAALLILVARGLARLFLEQSETYYDDR